MLAYVVVDLGFGDLGKGLLTDFLTRHFNAGVVVRYNGGAQAGHNVIAPDGRHHTFSQFGSGTFIPGVKTFLSKHVVIHPSALLVEGELLVRKGVRDAFSRIRVSDEALVITPFHQAANHIREIGRGENRHGSCGVGVGEAVEDARLSVEDSILVGELSNPSRLRRKLWSIRERKRAQLAGLHLDNLRGEAFAREWGVFERDEVIDTWIDTIAPFGALGLAASDSVLRRWLEQSETVIFEGAQGVLLDADAGFHPFTTWSCCTAENAHDLINEMAPGSDIYQIGVMRSYAVRHGPGPLPTETSEIAPLISEHNIYNEWQGSLRYGWFDSVLARYALAVSPGVDCLAVTHMDALSRLRAWKYCIGYRDGPGTGRIPGVSEVSGDWLVNFQLSRFLSLERREKFTQSLFKVTPVLEICESDVIEVLQKIESLLGHPVGLYSSGPSAENVTLLNELSRS